MVGSEIRIGRCPQCHEKKHLKPGFGVCADCFGLTRQLARKGVVEDGLYRFRSRKEIKEIEKQVSMLIRIASE